MHTIIVALGVGMIGHTAAFSQGSVGVGVRRDIAGVGKPQCARRSNKIEKASAAVSVTTRRTSSLASYAADDPYANAPPPTTFREAEVLGLRLMQDGRHDDALRAFQQAMKLPGSRPDIIRTANVSGPSPVGGSKGGTEGRKVMNLDEFEYQAAHYNVACAYACVGNVGESVANLKKAFDFGFDNYATVKADPDLSNVHSTKEFEKLMSEYDKSGFNPFGVFGKK